MNNRTSSSRILHLILWTAQLLLAAGLAWAASMKLFQPVEKLSAMWPWTGQVGHGLVVFTGIADLCAALGLVLPAWLRIAPRLTPVTAVAVVVLMLCAGIFHIVRGEVSVIGVNLFFAAVAVFIAWGRWKKVPVLPR